MDDGSPLLSITSLVLSLLSYSNHLFCTLQRKTLLLVDGDVSTNIQQIFWQAASWSNVFFNSILLHIGPILPDKLTSVKLFEGNSIWTYATILQSKYLPVASYTLMGCSIFYMFLVLRSVSVSYPDIAEDTDWKTTDNCGTYDFPSSSSAKKNHQSDSRFGGPVRDDRRNFMAVKDGNSPAPHQGLQRREVGHHSQNRYYGNSPSQSQSPGPSDYYMDSMEEHSMISDDGASEFSRTSNLPSDQTENSLKRESAANPSMLIGWQINAKGRGVGLILDMKKSLGRTTKYKVQFEDGSVKFLSLKRSDKKGTVPFSLIMKAN